MIETIAFLHRNRRFVTAKGRRAPHSTRRNNSRRAVIHCSNKHHHRPTTMALDEMSDADNAEASFRLESFSLCPPLFLTASGQGMACPLNRPNGLREQKLDHIHGKEEGLQQQRHREAVLHLIQKADCSQEHHNEREDRRVLSQERLGDEAQLHCGLLRLRDHDVRTTHSAVQRGNDPLQHPRQRYAEALTQQSDAWVDPLVVFRRHAPGQGRLTVPAGGCMRGWVRACMRTLRRGRVRVNVNVRVRVRVRVRVH